MRKALIAAIVFSITLPLLANNSTHRPGKDEVQFNIPEYRDPGNRTESYELYLADAFGDGWCWDGACNTLDLSVNGTVVLDDVTLDDGANISFFFDVEDWDEITTVFTEAASYAYENAFGIYDAEGNLRASGIYPDMDITTYAAPNYTLWSSVFLSEYAEGSSNNKYLEIFNAGNESVDLSNYSLSSCTNGCDDGISWDYPDNVTFDQGTILSEGDVYVVCHGSADDLIQAQCDQTFTYLSNGNDVFALAASASLGTNIMSVTPAGAITSAAVITLEELTVTLQVRFSPNGCHLVLVVLVT
mgnify:CR=1 FL=1